MLRFQSSEFCSRAEPPASTARPKGRFGLSYLLPILCLWLAGCSFVTDFDRSKIDSAGMDSGTGDGDGDGEGDGDEDGGGDGDGDMDGGPDGTMPMADSGEPDAIIMPACTVHDDCGFNQLCCQGMCKDTSQSECSDCGVACGAGLASACVQRECKCGTGDICSGTGDDLFCAGDQGAEVCVECRVTQADDCAGRPDNKHQCVAGACAACDPATNAGCTGNTPICNSNTLTCEKCTAANEAQCPGDLTCTGAGGCGGCNDSSDDCTGPLEPICNKTTTECDPCTGNGASPVCQQEQSKPYCVNNQRCSVCMPNDEMGCNPTTSATPDCRLNAASQYECQSCAGNDNNCSGVPGRDKCRNDGRCVECKTDSECSATGKPICDTDGTCKACDDLLVANTGDAQCAEKTPNTVCNGANGACVQCTGLAQCSGNDVCIGNVCADCTLDVHCTGHPAGGQCVAVGAAKECRQCDPAGVTGSNGCTGLQLCNPTTFTCQAVGCLDNGDCTTGGKLVCDTTAHVCVECLSNANCTTGGKLVCDTTAHACVECLSSANCTAAEPICNTTSHLCEACTADSQCPVGTVCATGGGAGVVGRCGACDPADSAECTTAAAPVCNGSQACVACSTLGDAAADAACVAKAGSNDVCVRTGMHVGECGICDPGDDQGCPAAPGNDQCLDGAILSCVGCLSTAECTGGQACVSNACAACTASAECTGSTQGSLCLSGACGCDAAQPPGSEGCALGQTCTAGVCGP